MPSALLPVELRHVERRVRLTQVLSACTEVGMTPVLGSTIHVLAYLTDALAPVWHLPIRNAQLLKREARPFFPALQRDLDWLVGAGVVVVHTFDYERENDDGWRLAASYKLNGEAANATLRLSSELISQRSTAQFVREVVLAASGLGDDELDVIGTLDAAYSSETADVGDVLDLDTEHDDASLRAEVNRSAAVAERLGVLAGAQFDLPRAELVHLYIRHLYSRARVA